MKKFLASVLSSAMIMTSLTAMSVSAEVVAEPEYDIHGNKCGEVIVTKDIDRDVHVKITMNTPDGDFVYYDSVIAADAEDPVYSYVLEGKDDASYTVSIGVAEFKSSEALQNQTDEIVVYDIDEITKETVAGYQYSYTVTSGEELKVETTAALKKNAENIYVAEKTAYFKMSDALKGDINSDGVINIRDAAAISKALASGQEISLNADYNGDGKVNVRDAAAIATFLAGNK